MPVQRRPYGAEEGVDQSRYLAFNEGIENLKEALANRNFKSEALTLAKAARSIRNDVFEELECRFNSVFEPGCQSRAVPTSLKCSVSMLLRTNVATD